MPGLEIEYEKFLDRVDEETLDPEWNIQHHPARNILDCFTQGFSAWVTWLEEILWLFQAGVPFGKDDFRILDWKALAILKQWNDKKMQLEELKASVE